MQVHTIHEIDCAVDVIEPAVVEAFLDAELSDDPMLADSIAALAAPLCAALRPRGVYKLFNPAICTLPPKYTEPAIKLVGTLAVLHGQDAYERMSEAEHTAMAVSTVGTDEEIASLRSELVHNDLDALLFDACLEALASLAADKLACAVAADAHERGLHRGSTLECGTGDFPLAMNKTLSFFVQTEKRLGLTADEDGAPSDRWSTWGVIGLYNETQKKRRGCAYCHNVRTCTIRKIGMTCHGRRTKKKAKAAPRA
ncbi:phage tail protein [Adlercreutzia caecimuris]|uniref:phage tail protein n=1 Tax=Adlercreutzia caecimuris TaxID=671266 RepID=UPI002494820A|nr:phage tail protein [Adlercreutzia caecimuris]